MSLSPRGLIKRVLESVLSTEAAARLGRRSRRGQCLVLAYHNVIPAGTEPDGDQSLHLDFDLFRRQLDVLEQHGGVVPLDTALWGSPDRACCAITFDDAYAGAVTLALPELARRRLPATVFVAPALLGRQSAWWDALGAGSQGLSETIRHQLLTEYGGDGERILTWAGQERIQLGASPFFRMAGEAEVLAAAALPGMTLGAHSWSHPNLVRTPDERLRHELEAPLEWLRERTPERVRPWLAYPYGLHDPRVRSAVESAGYALGLAIRGGWRGGGGTSLDFPRLNVPAGLTAPGLKTRLNGFLTG